MLEIADVRRDDGADWYEDWQDGEAWQFALVTFGKCVYWFDGRKTILDKGDWLLVPAGCGGYGKSVPTVFHSKYVATFRIPSPRPGLPLLERDVPVKLRSGQYDRLLERMTRMHDEWREARSYAAIAASALLTEMLTYACRELERGIAPESATMQHVETMRQYIRDHYRSKITKEQLGAAIRKSPNYAASLFSSVTGQTISGYVHALRVKTAVYMLSESLLTIGEIAEYLGYSDVSYFHKTFKRITGVAPSAYAGDR